MVGRQTDRVSGVVGHVHGTRRASRSAGALLGESVATVRSHSSWGSLSGGRRGLCPSGSRLPATLPIRTPRHSGETTCSSCVVQAMPLTSSVVPCNLPTMPLACASPRKVQTGTPQLHRYSRASFLVCRCKGHADVFCRQQVHVSSTQHLPCDAHPSSAQGFVPCTLEAGCWLGLQGFTLSLVVADSGVRAVCHTVESQWVLRCALHCGAIRWVLRCALQLHYGAIHRH